MTNEIISQREYEIYLETGVHPKNNVKGLTYFIIDPVIPFPSIFVQICQINFYFYFIFRTKAII